LTTTARTYKIVVKPDTLDYVVVEMTITRDDDGMLTAPGLCKRVMISEEVSQWTEKKFRYLMQKGGYSEGTCDAYIKQESISFRTE